MLLVPVAIVTVVGAAGEVLAPATPDVPRAVQLLGSGVNVLVSAGLLVLALLALVEARRAHAVQTAAG